MIRLGATLATAALVIWVASQASDEGGPIPASHPLAESARRTVDLVKDTIAGPAPLAEAEPLDPAPATAPEPAKSAPASPPPAPVDPAALVLVPGQTVEAPVPFGPDAPAETVEPVAARRTPPARTPLDRERTQQVRLRLDRVMSLAAGRER